jgi:hypothetical protein
MAVTLVWAGPDVLEVRTAARRRSVALGESQGIEAARLVALAVVDVVRPLIGPARPTPGRAAVAASGEGGLEAAARVRPVAEAAADARARHRADQASAEPNARLSLALLSVVNRGSTSAGFAMEPMAEVAWRLGGTAANGGASFGVAAQAGYGRGLGRVSGHELVLHFFPGRAGVWAQRGWWGLAAGAATRSYLTSGLDGGSGVLWGGFLSARASLDVGGGFSVLATGGTDLHPNGVDFRVKGRSLLSTGRVVPWLGLGVLWRRR